MAQYLTNMVGNDALRRRLASDILSNSFSHAYIIEGAEGSGRHTLARNIAAALCCLDRHGDTFPCLKCEACRKVLQNKTPDVILVGIEEDRTTIGVDTARFIRQDAMVVPNDFEHKIYIIEDADVMTTQAQNALLLTLEEPHSYAVFLLICNSASSLLETVRSRAPVIRTEPLSDELMTSYLTSTDSRVTSLSPDQLEALLREADGSIGRAQKLLDPKKNKSDTRRRELAAKFVEAFATKAPSSDRARLILEFSPKRDDVISELGSVALALRDLIVLKKSEDAPLCFYSDREAAIDLSYRFTIASLMRLYNRVDEASVSLSRNANVRLTLTSLIL